ncbi:MAG: LysR family transcriptional regulator [Acidobacteria bacterium]|nr:LysR family transcriptional regulator [Acidobacteriota bacterium]
MELRHLLYFLAVAEELHFGRAARRVHISQPPFSRQIQQLETELGVQLLNRTKRKVELTDAGRVLVGEARLILQEVERAAGLVKEADRQKLSRLVVGCPPPNNLVLRILRVFAERYPEVHILVKSLLTPQQIEALRDGLIDVGFLSLPVDREGLVIETILREQLVVALPKNHHLSTRRNIPLRALVNDTLIVLPLHMSVGRYGLVAEMCRRAGFSLRDVHEVDNIHTMLELVGSGFGVALMRASVQDVRRKDVVFRQLRHSPIVETGIAYRRENRSNILSLFVGVSKEVASSQTICLLPGSQDRL